MIRLPKARCAILALLSVMVPFIAQAQTAPPASAPENWGPISINLEEIDYPYPVSYMNFRVYNQDVRLAYMDVAPTGRSNGRTVILHHGGLYYGWYWRNRSLLWQNKAIGSS